MKDQNQGAAHRSRRNNALPAKASSKPASKPTKPNFKVSPPRSAAKPRVPASTVQKPAPEVGAKEGRELKVKSSPAKKTRRSAAAGDPTASEEEPTAATAPAAAVSLAAAAAATAPTAATTDATPTAAAAPATANADTTATTDVAPTAATPAADTTATTNTTPAAAAPATANADTAATTDVAPTAAADTTATTDTTPAAAAPATANADTTATTDVAPTAATLTTDTTATTDTAPAAAAGSTTATTATDAAPALTTTTTATTATSPAAASAPTAATTTTTATPPATTSAPPALTTTTTDAPPAAAGATQWAKNTIFGLIGLVSGSKDGPPTSIADKATSVPPIDPLEDTGAGGPAPSATEVAPDGPTSTGPVPTPAPAPQGNALPPLGLGGFTRQDRNPLAPKQPEKMGGRATGDAPSNAIDATKAAKRASNKDARAKLVAAVEQHRREVEVRVAEVAEELGIRVEDVRKEFLGATKAKGKRGDSLWDAKVRLKSIEVNEGKPPGQRLRLNEIQDLVRADDLEHPLTAEEEAKILEEHHTYREALEKGTRFSNKEASKDVTLTVDNVYKELVRLKSRTGVRSILLVAGSSVTDTIVPVCMGSPEALEFSSSILKMSSPALATTFESFSRIKTSGKSEAMGTFLQNRAEFVWLLGENLHTITGKSHLRIEYLNLEEKMEWKQGVKIVGWPADIPMKAPSNIASTENIATLLRLIRANIIRWELVTSEEREVLRLKYENALKKPRQPRKKKVVRTSDDEEDEESDKAEGDLSDDSQHGKKEKKKDKKGKGKAVSKKRKRGANDDDDDSHAEEMEQDKPPVKKAKKSAPATKESAPAAAKKSAPAAAKKSAAPAKDSAPATAKKSAAAAKKSTSTDKKSTTKRARADGGSADAPPKKKTKKSPARVEDSAEEDALASQAALAKLKKNRKDLALRRGGEGEAAE
ncbi:hypothetical protein K438DRAFT_1984263 [Mycena galopus ATCC 62051]|nr:hypothetical protein K438DRAFT_1984263 [Mycena galopus ATCC 62051]